ncbi:MAG: hypothetical protein HN930_04275 [Pelagibacterales bacterium]|jgi:uncharacterized protein YaaW (UPF0174 family)|nr:hypothetical protein [Pelagibacterales bacterium]|tara:strand:- start:59 stop:328 length:270 start_codon:yes stop_codon:yes gene_type:complete
MTKLLMAIYFLFTLLTNTYASDKDINADKDLLIYNCSSCHSLNTIYQQRLSEERWREIILLMYTENGMKKMNKKEEERLINYLSKNYNY